MAYIPQNDDEQQQSGMNVLAPQNQQQNTQQEAQNQPQNVSGGQSATITGGQAQQSSQGQSQAPKGQQKQAKSGMFTNIRKYMEQNKPGAQRMSGKLQQNVSQQNQNIQQAIGKQQSDFMSRVNQNRQRLQEAQQFGQQTLQQAQTQQSMPMLQQQQQDLQQRLGQFGDVSDQTQNIQNYQGQVQNLQGGYDQAQQAYQQAQQAYQQQAQQLGGALANVQSGQQMVFNQKTGDATGTTPTYFTREQVNQGLLSGDPAIVQAVQDQLAYEQSLINQQNLSPEDQQALDLQNRLNLFNQYQQQQQASQQALGQQQQALQTLEAYQKNLAQSQEQQRLYQNKQNLQNELTALEQKIASAPEQLTEDDITRFNNLRTGIERFDDAILNLSQQRREVGELQELAGSLQSSQGRRNLMRQEFGRQGGYTSGQAALDNLILTGDQNAMRELVVNSQAQADQAQSQLQEAFRQGRITQDEMARGTKQIQRDLQAGVEEAQTALLEGSKDYRTYRQAEDIMSGLDSYERRVLEKTLRGQDGLLITHDYTPTTPEQDARISEAMKKLRDIGYDSSMSGRQFTPEEMGLRGRAMTGEGTFIAELRDKLASGQGLSDRDMDILGLTGEERFNIDPNTLLRDLQISPTDYSIQDVANLTDVARADALARLSGEQAGENRFVTNELGIDYLDRQDMEQGRLSATNRESVDLFKEKLASNQVYGSIDEALNDIKNEVVRDQPALAGHEGTIYSLVKDGQINTNQGSASLEKVLAGDLQETQKLQDLIYWGGGGIVDQSKIISAVRNAKEKMDSVSDMYNMKENNALRREYESGEVTQNALLRALGLA